MRPKKIISAILTAAAVCCSVFTFPVTASAASGVSASKTYTWEYTAIKLKAQNSADKIYYTTDMPVYPGNQALNPDLSQKCAHIKKRTQTHMPSYHKTLFPSSFSAVSSAEK